MAHMDQATVNFERSESNTSFALLIPNVMFSNKDPPDSPSSNSWNMNDSYEDLDKIPFSLLVSPTTNGIIMKSSEINYLVNVTADVPIEYAMVMFGYIMPFLLILTIISNSLVVIVLSRKHMITPTNIVLLAMAISDMLTLLFPAPWYFYMYTLGYHDKILYPTTACYAFHCMIEVLPAFFHTASIWLTLLLAIQRYIYVCHPTLARTWCTGWFFSDIDRV